ncbi:HAMP domain-containing histidine kinase [Paenibacillus sp. HWE-109]|uniref:sensor histidine kinase n=1 Tax=Paenibacillus sp. HWE-109 TaxID=1306526 RepID=UPI001EDD8F27|nr:HAMP domain-containing sensor histidine kinase [Paenibacillus sp. HWE-109]UKS28536.1 HAMP domain-containing histidine kinase [Paenibacillus sp. HWE-109]
MKNKPIKHIFDRMRLRRNADIFGRMRNRLTIMYSGMLMIFLLLFITIVYSSLFLIVSYQQKQEIKTIADQELVESQKLLENDINGNEQNIDGRKIVLANKNLFFYYVVNQQGKLIAGDEIMPSLRPTLIQMISGWIPKNNEVDSKTEKLFYGRNGHNDWNWNDKDSNDWNSRDWKSPNGNFQNDQVQDKKFSVSQGKQIHLMIAARSIYDGNQRIGMMYIGKDTTYYWNELYWMLTIFIGLAVLFFVIALLVGHFMSKRAMVPIIQSYTQQREFVADASHELRTPLSILNSSIDVLELEERENISDFSQSVLLDMKDEVKRMTTLVNDLLTLARSDSGTPSLLYETFDFIPIIDQLARTIQPLAASRQIKLNLRTSDTLWISGDKERLKQLLYILLDNAIKYTPDQGDVDLTLSMDVNEGRRDLLIHVKDTGIGIKPEEQKKIFDRFYRVDKNRTKQIVGTGIGLAIAKWIVDEHRGTIKLSSTPGEGSTFTIMIPLTDPQKSS